MLEMFEGFGELGIFGDVLGPVIAEKEKKQAKKKEEVSTTKKKMYPCPMKILFDSMEAISIEESGEIAEDALYQQITEKTGCNLFEENQSSITMNKLKDNIYLLRPSYSTKYEKGSDGKWLLIQHKQDISLLIEPDDKGVFTAEAVKNYVLEQYGLECTLHLIGDTYMPVPKAASKLDLDELKFPVRLTALTLFGEMLEVGETDYQSFFDDSEEEEQTSFLEKSEETVSVSEDILKKVIVTYLPEYGEDLQFSFCKEKNLLQVMHGSTNSGSNSPAPAAKKEEMYPTNAVVSLVFTKMELSSALFGGKKEITKKELIKHIGKTYPEYSMERTDIQYDKKSNLIIPILKSGKRGKYSLEEDEWFRKEESDLMTISARKEVPDEYGCVAGNVKFQLPKIPFNILQEILHFFWDLYVYKGTEVIVQIHFNRKCGEYEIYVPYQEVTSGSVDFERNIEMEHDPDKILVMEIHSHGCYKAKWSDTDNNEELAHRLYGVVGDLHHFRYDGEHLKIRAATGGYFVRISPGNVFQYPETEEEYHPEMSKIRIYG